MIAYWVTLGFLEHFFFLPHVYLMLFGWSGNFYFPEIEIRWPKKKAFDHGNHFTPLFSLQSISGKWERESARARSRSPVADKHSNRDQRQTFQSRSTARSRRQTFQSLLIAISPSRDRAIDRDRRREISYVGECRRWWFFSRLWLVFFWICVFLLLFQTPENIFWKIFWNATKHHGNIFLFWKLAFPENMYFPENVLQQPNTA